MAKLSQIEAYKKHNDSSISAGNKRIQFDRHNLIRADHPSNKKRGDVCIYHKESLVIRVFDVSFINECILCEVSVQNKRGYIAVMYRSPSQSNNEFDNFLKNFDNLLNKVAKSSPIFTVIL